MTIQNKLAVIAIVLCAFFAVRAVYWFYRSMLMDMKAGQAGRGDALLDRSVDDTIRAVWAAVAAWVLS